MPLIKKPHSSTERKKSKIYLNQNLLIEIENYCKWAELPSTDYFIEQASMLALKKDKDWKKNRMELFSNTATSPLL